MSVRGFVVALAVLVLRAAPAGAQVVITDLGLIGSAVSSSANAINSAGDIAGISVYASAPINRAAVWHDHVGVELDLGCPTCQTVAHDINDSGDIVGMIYTTNPNQGNGFFHSSGGATLILPPLPGDTGAIARSLNNLGIVVGQSFGPAGSRPVMWINGVPESLGVLGSNNGFTFGVAESISDNGVIVGQSSVTGAGNQAFRWQAGVMVGLGTLPVGSCQATSTASGINENGVIVGTSNSAGVAPNCDSKPVRWVNGVIEQLPSALFGTALDINENGDIVGNTGAGGQQVATLWRNGEAISLGGLSGFLQSIAGDISDTGLIAGRSLFSGGRFRANSWTLAMPNTPPSLNLPFDYVVNADSSDGAVVFFTVTANDNEDGTFLASCTPSDGSLFPIGTTTVDCQATDSGGLGAAGSFFVTVLGPIDQLENMFTTLGADGSGGSLQSKLNAVLESLENASSLQAMSATTTASSNKGGGNSCALLQAFINEVKAQSGKKITAAQATALVAAAERIRAIIGC